MSSISTTLETQHQTPPTTQDAIKTDARPERVIWAAEVTPLTVRKPHHALRDAHRNHDWAARWARQPGVIVTAWSRDVVGLVVVVDGYRGVKDGHRAVRDILNAAGGSTAPRVLDLEAWCEPDSWDFQLPTVEKIARAALAGQHQCWGRSFCMCGFRGLEFENRYGNRGERGYFEGTAMAGGVQ